MLPTIEVADPVSLLFKSTRRSSAILGLVVTALTTFDGISAGVGSEFHPKSDFTPVQVDLPASLATPFRSSLPRTATAETIDANATGSSITVHSPQVGKDTVEHHYRTEVQTVPRAVLSAT